MLKTFLQEGSRFTVETQKQGPGYYTGISEEGKADSTLAVEKFAVGHDGAFTIQTAHGLDHGKFFFVENEVFVHIRGQNFSFKAASLEQEQEDISGHRSPMPGKVIAVNVAPGKSVKKDETLIIVEAMKMENAIKASRDGVVSLVRCSVGDLVSPEINLVELE